MIYEKTNFYDPQHKHITTGDLKIVEKKILAISVGPNYRKPTHRKVYLEIDQALKICIENINKKKKKIAEAAHSIKEIIQGSINYLKVWPKH